MFHDSPVQGILQDWKLEVPLVKLPAEMRQVSYLHTYKAKRGEASGGSLLIMSTYPILNANHSLIGTSRPDYNEANLFLYNAESPVRKVLPLSLHILLSLQGTQQS